MNRERIIRAFRITTSAVFGVLCALLIALWIRSHVWDESFNRRISPTENMHFGSDEGVLYLEKSIVSPWRGPLPAYSREKPDAYANRYKLILRPTILITPTGRQLAVPYWCLLGLTTTFAFLPWMKCHFSMRTLLIAMALIAATLGALVNGAR
jgi:hypothetical protein